MRIALVTDSHLAPQATALNDNWQAVRRFVARSRIDLTIHLGDITVDGAGDAAQFGWALQLSADWPSALRFLPGNHDIGDNPPDPGTPRKHPLDPARLAQYRQAFGPDYWTQEAAGWRLVGLNAQLFGSGTEAEAGQWAWLEDVAATAGDRPTVVLLHKPLFQAGPDDAEPHIRYVPIVPRRRLLPLLDALDTRLVLSGHTHQYLDRTLAGRRHVWLPSTAFWIPDALQERVGEKVVGLGLLELAPDGYRLDFVCPDGMARNSLFDNPIYPGVEAAAAAAREAS